MIPSPERPKHLERLEYYREFIELRRKRGGTAKIFPAHADYAPDVAAILAAGGTAAITWGEYRRRRIYCLIGAHDTPGIVETLNLLKNREKTQPLGAGCVPESVRFIADLRNTPALLNVTADFLKKPKEDLTDSDFDRFLSHAYNRSLGLVFKAQDHLPDEGLGFENGTRTILVVGENSLNDPSDIYNATLWELATVWGKFVWGTSANPRDNEVFSYLDERKMRAIYNDRADAIISQGENPPAPDSDAYLTSSTIVSLVGKNPQVLRMGNHHPVRFEALFPGLTSVVNPKRYPNSESLNMGQILAIRTRHSIQRLIR